MIADDVDDGAARPSGVVQIGQAVSEAGPEVQERARRLPAHPGISIGRSGDDLEQAEHATHLRSRVEGGHEVHLAGPRVGEAGGHP